MATYPDISKGNGLVRTYDLLSCLISDVHDSFEQLESNQESQHLRRSTVRTVFSFIEGIIQILKFELKADIRLERTKIALSKKETEILYEIRIVDEKKIPWNIPLDVNLKKTIALTKKLWNLKKVPVDFKSQGYQHFLTAKDTRNRLTHPRTYYDIQISDDEVFTMLLTFEWLKNGFLQTMQEKINTILETMPDDFVNRYRVETLKEYRHR